MYQTFPVLDGEHAPAALTPAQFLAPAVMMYGLDHPPFQPCLSRSWMAARAQLVVTWLEGLGSEQL